MLTGVDFVGDLAHVSTGFTKLELLLSRCRNLDFGRILTFSSDQRNEYKLRKEDVQRKGLYDSAHSCFSVQLDLVNVIEELSSHQF